MELNWWLLDRNVKLRRKEKQEAWAKTNERQVAGALFGGELMSGEKR